ncbi:hypothetical protein AWB78_08614 [Caballeronia calidae]|uniref:Uncharacterized protein n=1 Tax=Caballeronia calidae TaxID=1777139 RepID=A0A158ELB2_9BURK|nr:hypothetical protein AWB78_08614 [Caballeronia calidae]
MYGPLLPRLQNLLINLLKPILQLLHLRLEVGLIDDAVGIAVDQPRLAFFQLSPLLFKAARVEATLLVALDHIKPTLVFVLQSIWMP